MIKEVDMNMRFRFLGKALIALLAVIVLGWVVSGLWNAVMPGLFDGVHQIGYWHALGLLILSRLLFGGFRGRGRGRGGWRAWENMSPEERERFKAGRGGCWPRRRGPQPEAEG